MQSVSEPSDAGVPPMGLNSRKELGDLDDFSFALDAELGTMVSSSNTTAFDDRVLGSTGETHPTMSLPDLNFHMMTRPMSGAHERRPRSSMRHHSVGDEGSRPLSPRLKGYKQTSRPSSPYRDDSPYRRPRAFSSQSQHRHDRTSSLSQSAVNPAVSPQGQQTIRQRYTADARSHHPQYLDAIARRFQHQMQPQHMQQRSSMSSSTHSSMAGAGHMSRSYSLSAAQTPVSNQSRSSVRTNIVSVDDELASLFDVALGSAAHQQHRPQPAVPLQERELPPSFWSPKKNPNMATVSPRASPRPQRRLDMPEPTPQANDAASVHSHHSQNVDFDPYVSGYPAATPSSAERENHSQLHGASNMNVNQTASTPQPEASASLPELDALLGELAGPDNGLGSGMALFEGLDHLLEAEANLLGMADNDEFSLFEGLGTTI
ncbi:uncharacterized protein MONBRDRAFT_7817 [Monosiga brevicollis MX1]|uniref:Uncharacterized protein n=1 Tax=Monosiga brevicollis TaxID=81824 RepID=A9UXI0_MONBE|nr:uncharacterized protein MONBRDRAFT_7817 [Monosiga brevicollis MX1]EDQ90011.1 predicted protein [Monosiga brevicollis MX1]|eukprot:XP_001745433.1 hypothetical protein [Monosiga brevicollis MX1]